MVNANEWLNKTIPADKREQATTLYIYRKCQCNISIFKAPLFGAKPTTSSPATLFGVKPPPTPAPLVRAKPSVLMPPTTVQTPFGSTSSTSSLFGSRSNITVTPNPKLFKPITAPPVPVFGIPFGNERPTKGDNDNYCQICNTNDQNNCSYAPDYYFYNVILEGDLDLNEFVNLKILYIEGTEQDKKQQQKLTSLKIDKCINLTHITINNTTLGCLSLGCKPKLQSTNFFGNKQLIFRDSILKNQIEKLSGLILNTTKNISLNDLRLEIKKIEEENLKCLIDSTKSNLDESNQSWLDSLLEAQQEVLHSNNAYARNQLDRCKNMLNKVLTVEDIQDILGKLIEINELETQLNKASLKD
ncbi:8240_t:CDS:1 [Dentiscutata erythropus]|uniref:8240_t:CDS:1 n=1 Tax=Dentiscutata erythropus TaxID=1348616 RepID=A0A9N9JCW8_9GLOM|nr:8240_t:CDS:1 [Dentiscutata erythropus]